MRYTIEKKIPSSKEIKKLLPLDSKLEKRIKIHQDEIKQILSGEDSRKLLIIGPCSAWPNTSVLEYARELKNIEDKYKDKIKLIMRVYTQKPRTALGWTGPINQPNPFEEPDLEEGIKYCRKMMINVNEIGLPIADEAVFTQNGDYFLDLISWVAIGARTSESQQHRIFGSMLEIPAGYKNTTSGNIDIAINSIITAQHQHVDAVGGYQIRTHGNPYAHLILRGGDNNTNYSIKDIEKAANGLIDAKISNPAIVIDLSHENSIDPKTGKKDAKRQPIVLNEILENMKLNPLAMNHVKGFMCESYILNGNYKPNSHNDLKCGLSITDACLGLEDTKIMIENLYENL